ncbi:MAG: Mfa1 family fimbria major subunit [Porphyromonas endodontalis]|uniref:Mfa1 family fimbria major subunit n=1 Tax=Porphyromonas endodontalis TaxID=28124 RepID=UPI003FA158C5
MKMKMMAGALLAALGLFASCSKSGKDVQDPNQEGSTYVGITLNMGTNDLRANEDDNYNPKGKWNGKDKIETIDVYVVDVTSGVVSTGFYNKNNFTIEQTDGAPSIKITPKTAIRTTPGAKRVYALVNASAEVTQKLANASATVFENVYNNVEQDFAIASLAKNVAGSDIIMASNAKESTLTVLDGVTEAEAKAGTKNRAVVEMKRLVARVVVTTKEETFQVMYSDGVTKMGTVKKISYAGAQGEKKFYIGQKVVGGLIKTPAYDYIPNAAQDIWSATGKASYDYSDLKDHTFTNNPRYATKISGTLTVEQIGEKSLAQTLFMYEASHKYQTNSTNTDVNLYDGGFRRGNTPYVLVRAVFVPEATAFADGTGNTYVEGKDFYLGANNKFYSELANVTNPLKGGVVGQKFRHYVKGKVLYYAFVNPDRAPGTLDAPVFRNNIYHINITGFKTIGTNWNPLFPEDPANPNPGGPENPDPKPSDDPDNPNPFNPDDPNTPKETWMSVEMSVLAWTVHSYDIELSL